jgi:hypothetical protein
MLRSLRRFATLTAVWLVWLAGSTAVGVWAVGTVGADLTTHTTAPLSSTAVDRELGSLPSTPPTSPPPDPTPSPSVPVTSPTPPTLSVPASPPTQPASPTQRRTYGLRGGTVAVLCSDGHVALEYATPRDGYRVETGRGATGSVEVRFIGHERESDLSARCVGGVPRAETQERGDE